MPRGVRQFDKVRVRALLRAAHEYDAWWVNRRPPRFGDFGTVVELLNGEDGARRFVVECVGADGSTVWLSEFCAEELLLQS